jgi:phytoene desaturase
MSKVVVIGGGVGGLAAAIRLASAGHAVTLLERSTELGGKLAVWEREGFTFDIGPSLVTMPYVIDECFRTAGRRLVDEVGLVRLDPQFRYRWPDGSTLDVRDDRVATAREFERFAPGSGEDYRRFVEHGRRIWDVSERTFFAGPMSGPLQLLRRMRSPRDLVAIDAMRSLDRAASGLFHDHRLVQWAGRYATYSGSSPYRAPATLGCIPAIESAYGTWYPMGGLGVLRDAFVRVARAAGAELRTESDVVACATTSGRVTAVELASGEMVAADVVVANVDAHHLYADLLPDARALAKVDRAARSTSGVVVLVGTEGTTPGIAHHSIWFSSDSRAEFAQLDAGTFADEPTVYACVSSVSDPSQAPPGCENWFVLVNAPSHPARLPDRYDDVVLDVLERRGVSLRARARFVEVITPADIERRYRVLGGAIYGASSNGRRAAFLRPANRGPVRGLYLVGGSSHPGGGLPLVTISARIVADMIREDGW